MQGISKAQKNIKENEQLYLAAILYYRMSKKKNPQPCQLGPICYFFQITML